MKETVYTIPINEAFELRDGCPVCRLAAKLEADAVEYVMGAAMMEPDVREETNRLGFCARHFTSMAALRKRLPLALILESHIAELLKKPAKNIPAAAQSCFICSRVEGFLEKMLNNIVYLWKSEESFRRLFNEQPHICLVHAGALYNTTELKKRELESFRSDVLGRAVSYAESLNREVSLFVKSFDHRFADMDIGDAKTSPDRAIKWLTGGQQL